MKKTLFLSALIATALCSSAFGATSVTVAVTDSNTPVALNNVGGSNYLDGEHVITITMDNGTKITNGGQSCGGTSVQIASITLNGTKSTAEIEATSGCYGIINSGYSLATLALNGGTLKKTGTGEMLIAHTEATAGTLDLTAGMLTFLNKDEGDYALDGADLTLKAAAGTTIQVAKNSRLKELVTSGTTLSFFNQATLTVGTLTVNSGTQTLPSSLVVTEAFSVGTGAVLQMSDNTRNAVTLAGGTVKVSASGDFNQQHFASLALTADSKLDLTEHTSGLINKDGSSFATSTLDLGVGKTLTIDGLNRFCLMDVTTDGYGKITFDDSGAYLQIAHKDTTGHTADLSTAVVELKGSNLIISSGNTLKVAGLANVAGNTGGSVLRMDGNDPGTRDLVIAGDGKEHTYLGGFDSDTRVNLSMTGAGTQNFSLTGNLSMALESLTAEAGTMNFFLNHDTNSGRQLTTGSLTLSGGVVNVYDKNATEGTAGQITTTNGLTVTETTEMEANLVVGGGTMIFANNTTLTMGCAVTIGMGDTVTVELTQEMVDTIAGGGRVDLFTSVETATLGSHIVFTGTNGAALDKADTYSLQYDAATKTIYATPEPATATLSLLALAGLCARRKRH